jgi:hypothetical protein
MVLIHPAAFINALASTGVPMPDHQFTFSHGQSGLVRFPPNVEQISVEHESACTWLGVRRNDVELRLPLSDEDCRHLAALLTRDA